MNKKLWTRIRLERKIDSGMKAKSKRTINDNFSRKNPLYNFFKSKKAKKLKTNGHKQDSNLRP